MSGNSGPVGPLGIHVSGGQGARQSVMPDKLRGKRFYNGVLFPVRSVDSKVPIVLYMLLMIQGAHEANETFLEASVYRMPFSLSRKNMIMAMLIISCAFPNYLYDWGLLTASLTTDSKDNE